MISTIDSLLRDISHRLAIAGIDSYQRETELILSSVLQLQRFELYLQKTNFVTAAQQEEIYEITSRRCFHEPLQYILGNAPFLDLDIQVSPAVLIPRFETELLVDIISKMRITPLRILDVCTGSGVLAIALAKLFPQAEVIASDISESALLIAIKNAIANHVKIQFIKSNLFDEIQGSYDLIVSNPPYISEKEYQILAKEVKDYEPKIALVAPEDGLFFYRVILEQIRSYLSPMGSLFFEIGADQSESISLLAKKNNFRNLAVYQDLSGRDRFLHIQQ